MKKTVFWALVLVLSSSVTLDVVRAGKDDPPEPPPIFQSRVVNDATEPVPVQGALSVSGAVSVDNFPPEPLKEPFNLIIGMDLFHDPNTGFGTDIVTFDVPMDKQLTVETVSMDFILDEGAEVTFRVICVSDFSSPSSQAIHFLEPLRTLPLFSGTARDTLAATGSVKCLVPPGGQVRCFAKSTDTDAGGRCNISGYMESVP